MDNKHLKQQPIDSLITWVGSTSSLVLHTLVFIASFIAGWLEILPLNMILLILTTAVSLEAIYLAIFIQMTVNKHSASLKEVEEDIDEISEDVEDIQEDFEDINESHAHTEHERKKLEALHSLSSDVRRVMEDLKDLKENIK